jgi:hypothetical protein
MSGLDTQSWASFPYAPEGNYAAAFTFADNPQNYVLLPPFAIGGAMTICVYYRLNSIQSWERFIDFGNGPAADNIILEVQSNSYNFEFNTFQGSNAGLVQGNNMTLAGWGAWAHVCCTLTSTGAATVGFVMILSAILFPRCLLSSPLGLPKWRRLCHWHHACAQLHYAYEQLRGS